MIYLKIINGKSVKIAQQKSLPPFVVYYLCNSLVTIRPPAATIILLYNHIEPFYERKKTCQVYN